MPCPPPGDPPDPGIKPEPLTSPALADGVFTTCTTWEAQLTPQFCFHLFMLPLRISFSCGEGLHCVACGILAHQPGIKPSPLHWKCSVNHWTTRQVLGNLFLISMELSMYYRATSSRLRTPIRNPVRGTVKTLTTLYDTDTNQGPYSTVKDKYVNKIQSEEDKRAINEQDRVSTSQH